MLREINGARLGELLHALREAHGVADRSVGGVEVVADGADDHLAGTEPDPHGEVDAPAAQLRCVGGELVLQMQRRVARTPGVVLMGDRRAEDGHDPVAGEGVDGSLEAVDASGQDGEDVSHDPPPLLRIRPLRHLHRADDVSEQDRDVLALALGGGGTRLRRRDRRRLRTPVAEEVQGGVLREHGRLEPAQLGSRLERQLLYEPLAARSVGR